MIDPTHRILILQRVSKGSFASAHVFPGGNVSSTQDGLLPSADTPELHHADSKVYRLAAVRETFEETGLLLAKSIAGHVSSTPNITTDERANARREIHNGKLNFCDWLRRHECEPDIGQS